MSAESLKKLLKARSCRGRYEGELGAVRDDSRDVREGDVFVAIRGATSDGHRFIEDALKRGAGCLVLSDPEFRPARTDVITLLVADDRDAIARLAAWQHRRPAQSLSIVGVTGTNGKTSTATLMAHVFRHLGLTAGHFGTTGNWVGGRFMGGDHTTPGPLELHELLRAVVDQGGRHVSMEVSSHALHQGRALHVPFAVGVFTNLTQDHLDYHKSLDQYLAAKAILFESLKRSATAVLNGDDPASDYLEQRTKAKVLRYGLGPGADVRAEEIRYDMKGTSFSVATPWGCRALDLPFVGAHNVANVLAAISALSALGFALDDVVRGLEQAPGVPGRLEAVPNDHDLGLYVDYAHTPDAIAKVCAAVREFVRERLIVVFGCGGNRDATKRAPMGRAAQEAADLVIVTSDNPRFEHPDAIISDIMKGLDDSTPVIVEPKRREAIRRAVIEEARAGDVVLILGKGHETYQIIGARLEDFDDRQVAAQCLLSRAPSPQPR